MSAPTRERAPVMVWRRSQYGVHWLTACHGCRTRTGGYGSWADAFKAAQEHANTCHALRLARLEAELEKAIQRLDVELRHASPRARYWEGYDAGLNISVGEIRDVLARHRGTDAH